MSCASDRWASESGQATVEAAFALPVLMLLFLMLLQPGIILYDRMVMSSAAAEGCRLLSTSADADSSACEDYVKRRLSAIPQVDIFHVHGGQCSYSVRLSGDERSETVSVAIANRVKPLPLLDLGMSLGGMTDAAGTLGIEVEASAQTQPGWVGDSSDGRDPSRWAAA